MRASIEGLSDHVCFDYIYICVYAWTKILAKLEFLESNLLETLPNSFYFKIYVTNTFRTTHIYSVLHTILVFLVDFVDLYHFLDYPCL